MMLKPKFRVFVKEYSKIMRLKRRFEVCIEYWENSNVPDECPVQRYATRAEAETHVTILSWALAWKPPPPAVKKKKRG